jgi:hypothetical protein
MMSSKNDGRARLSHVTATLRQRGTAGRTTVTLVAVGWSCRIAELCETVEHQRVGVMATGVAVTNHGRMLRTGDRLGDRGNGG